MNVYDLELDSNPIRSRFEFKFMTKNDNSIIIIFLG